MGGPAVVSGCEAAEMFEAIGPQPLLDLVAVFVDGGIMGDRDPAIALGRDHRLGPHARIIERKALLP